MKRIALCGMLFAFFVNTPTARSDFFGGDLPLLAQIVFNSLQTLFELEKQTTLAKEQMEGIKAKINRLKSISDLVQPSSWKEWKDPAEAIKRLRQIYYAIPKEYQTEKSKAIEEEISKALQQIGVLSSEAKDAFQSGKQLERLGAESSPGVAQKLAASGTGTLVALAAQEQVIQSHITSLLAQLLATSNEREARALVSNGKALESVSGVLDSKSSKFSSRATTQGVKE
jgi:hypothetical protein